MKKYIISLFIALIAIFSIPFNVSAAVNPPVFPSCENLNKPGDWVTSDSGFHHIPGQEAPIKGSDDVYYLEGGNFVQCLCAESSVVGGIQTNWWNIGNLELTNDEIKSFTDQGWYLLNGKDWNLLHTQYLAKNVAYTCHEQPRGGNGDDHSSECTNLSASSIYGTAPLTVTFQGEGLDTAGYVQEYEFSFNDSSDGQPTIYRTKDSSAAHRYVNPGVYTAKLLVKDSKGVWKGGNKCDVTINVTSVPQVLGASTTSVLPKTGVPAIMVLGSIISLASGVLIYRRNG